MSTRTILLWGLTGLAGLLSCSVAWGQEAPSPEDQAAELWTQMCRSDVNSPQFISSQENLHTLIDGLRADRRVPVATAMMIERRSDSPINGGALQEFFGTDAFSSEDLRTIVMNDKRSWKQGMLVLTYYRFVLPENRTRLTEPVRRSLLKLLADRIGVLAGRKSVPYREQRFISHMLQDALSRYSLQSDDVPEMVLVRKAMQQYVATPREKDSLAASINRWLTMPIKPVITSETVALEALGHWDPLVRKVAAAEWLSRQVARDSSLADKIIAKMRDPQDEVRESAAMVFSYAFTYKPDEIIPLMVRTLVWDPSVIVQRAAYETLVARRNEAQIAIDQLLTALQARKPKAGPKRTNSILRTLAYLVHDNTPTSLKQRLLEVAMANLDYAPDGAIKALEALGPFAKPAVPALIDYRDNRANRFLRQRIDRHTLHEIDPDSIRGGN